MVSQSTIAECILVYQSLAMNQEYDHLSKEEKVKAENDFLKMKIMIEHGGDFYSEDDNANVPPDIENEFLTNVIEFERQFSLHKTITVFEKIGSPQHFKRADEIPEREVEQAWENLSNYMSEHGVELSACSPRVSARELYRFVTEELFKHETDDITIPGMITGFIYDEFYPDHEYDNTRTATEDCVRPIFCKEPLEWMHHFAKKLRLNDRPELAREEFNKLINDFKDVHDELDLIDLAVGSANISEKLCLVKGNYTASAKIGNECTHYKGNWLVEFILDDDLELWQIDNVQIDGIAF